MDFNGIEVIGYWISPAFSPLPVAVILRTIVAVSALVAHTTTKRDIMSTINAGTHTTNDERDKTSHDAFDLGQCCMDPCSYIFAKSLKLWNRRNGRSYQQSTKTKQTHITAAKNNNTADDKDKQAVVIFAVQQATYVLVMGGGWTIIFLRAYPLLDRTLLATQVISSSHKTAGVLIFIACIASWLLAKFTPPGSITKETLYKFDNYKYDGVLYRTGCVCPTSKIRKLARSKFDRFSFQQVPRFDHFCGWLGNSIGEENYRFFLIFVTVHTFMAFYGTIMTFVLMKAAGQEALLNSTGNTNPGYFHIYVAALGKDPLVVATAVALLTSVPLFVQFLCFHASLVRRGMTTNEHFKWRVRNNANSRPPLTDEENARSSIPPPCAILAASLPTTKPEQFYNLGWAGNIYEVFFPRSLRIEVKAL